MKKHETFLLGVCIGGLMGAFLMKKRLESRSVLNVSRFEVLPQKEEITLERLMDELDQLSSRVEALQQENE